MCPVYLRMSSFGKNYVPRSVPDGTRPLQSFAEVTCQRWQIRVSRTEWTFRTVRNRKWASAKQMDLSSLHLQVKCPSHCTTHNRRDILISEMWCSIPPAAFKLPPRLENCWLRDWYKCQRLTRFIVLLYLLTEVCFSIIYSMNSRTCISDRDRGHPCHKTLHLDMSLIRIRVLTATSILYASIHHSFSMTAHFSTLPIIRRINARLNGLFELRDFCLFILYALFLLND
jgi:hypothetical protein